LLINNKKLLPEKGKSFYFLEIKNRPLSFPFGLELAPSGWIAPGLLAGRRARSLAALLITKLF
jgi:hypothetical protein